MLECVKPVIDAALVALAGQCASPRGNMVVANTLPFARTVMLSLGAEDVDVDAIVSQGGQRTTDGVVAAVSVPPGGIASLSGSLAPAPAVPVMLEQRSDGTILLQNEHLQAVIGPGCVVHSLVHVASGRECVTQDGTANGANRYLLFEDYTLAFDACKFCRSHRCH